MEFDPKYPIHTVSRGVIEEYGEWPANTMKYSALEKKFPKYEARKHYDTALNQYGLRYFEQDADEETRISKKVASWITCQISRCEEEAQWLGVEVQVDVRNACDYLNEMKSDTRHAIKSWTITQNGCATADITLNLKGPSIRLSHPWALL
jgi:hypothetical protein